MGDSSKLTKNKNVLLGKNAAIFSCNLRKNTKLMIFFRRSPGLVLAPNTRLNGVLLFLLFLHLRAKSLRIVHYFHVQIRVQPCRDFRPNRGGICENLPYVKGPFAQRWINIGQLSTQNIVLWWKTGNIAPILFIFLLLQS